MQRWYVSREGEKAGPYSDSQLTAMAVNWTLTPVDLIWREGLPSWGQAGRLRGLFPQAPAAGLKGANPPPLPPASHSTGIAASLSPPARASVAGAGAGKFVGKSYTVRRKFFKLFGGAFHLLD